MQDWWRNLLTLQYNHTLNMGLILSSFREDPISKKALYAEEQTGGHKSCLPCIKNKKYFFVYVAPAC